MGDLIDGLLIHYSRSSQGLPHGKIVVRFGEDRFERGSFAKTGCHNYIAEATFFEYLRFEQGDPLRATVDRFAVFRTSELQPSLFFILEKCLQHIPKGYTG